MEALERRLLLSAAGLGAVAGFVPVSAGGPAQAAAPVGVGARVNADLLALRGPGGSGRGLAPSSPTLLQTQGGMVGIRAVARGRVRTMLAELAGLGFVELAHAGRLAVGALPIAAIDRLAGLGGLAFVDPTYAAQTFSGAVATQGDGAVRADAARTLYGVDGSGVKVGVISDSYDAVFGARASADIASGDLPPANRIDVVREGPPVLDEGRAMMQIIHDVAPGASLAFDTAFADAGGVWIVSDLTMAAAINELVRAGCDVIVDDFAVPDEPMFMDGFAASAVNAAVASGVAYFSAAGNGGRLGYESGYRASGRNLTIGGVPAGQAHDFDPGPGIDPTQTLTVPPGGFVSIEFQWDQPFASVAGVGSASDLNVYVVDKATGTIVAQSVRSNVNGDPYEVLQFANTTASTQFDLIVTRVAGPAPGLMKYVGRQSSFTIDEYGTASATLYGHQNAAGGAAVGAAGFYDTPAFGVAPPRVQDDAAPDGYGSSAGGTPILFGASGQRLATPQARAQPRFVGPDGVNTTFFGVDSGVDADDFPNFFGTSAAAPHVAAVAALLLDAVPTATPAEIYAALSQTAVDMDDPFLAGFQAGFDFATGAGLVVADDAARVLGGTRVGPEITVLAGATPIADGQPTPIDFGAVEQGQAGRTLTFTVRNDGFVPLELGAVEVPTGYTVVEPLAATLGPGQGDTFAVRLDGATVGVKAGMVFFSNNDPDEDPFDFPVAGAVTPPAARPNLAPHKLVGRSDKIVVSTVAGTSADAATITTADAVYVDWAVINSGAADVNAPFATRLLLDGEAVGEWVVDGLQVNYYVDVRDYGLAPMAAGPHTLTLEADRTGLISESNESDNGYTRAFTVVAAVSGAPGVPKLLPTSDTGASDADGVTNRDNSAAGKTLEFSVGGTVPGALVELLADGRVVGSRMAAGEVTVVTTDGVFDLTDGAHTLTARQTEPDKTASAATAATAIRVDTLAPTVSGPTFEFATGQALRFPFSEDVAPSLTGGGVGLRNLSLDRPVDGVSAVLAIAGDVGTFALNGLPDANYRATLAGAGVTDVAGNALAADVGLDFFVLAGDADRDRSVGSGDLLILAMNYGKPGTWARGDFNYDGTVNFADLLLLAKAYNKGLPAPVAIPPAPSVQGASRGEEVELLGRAGPSVFSTGPVIRATPVPARAVPLLRRSR